MRQKRRAVWRWLAVALVSTTAEAKEPPIDTVYLGGKVFTADPAHPWVEAIATRGERIARVGSRKEIEKVAPASARRVELNGRTVIPGLNDAHHHFVPKPADTVNLDGSEALDWDGLVSAVASAAARAPPGATIVGGLGLKTWFNPRATRAGLDPVAGNHPVILSTFCGHGAVVNGAMLGRYGLGETPSDLPGGWFERAADGRTTNGRLREAAILLLEHRRTEAVERPARLEQLRRLVQRKLRLGWTSLQTMSTVPVTEMAQLALDGGSPLRFRVIRLPVNLEDAAEARGHPELPRRFGPRVTVSGLKWFLDGTPCEKTNSIQGAFPDGTKPPRLYSPEQVRTMLETGERQHQQLLFHIAGSGGVEELLTAMDSMPNVPWASRRVRIEHGDELWPAFFDRARRLGVVLVQNPAHLVLPPSIPAEAFQTAYPDGPFDLLRSVLEARIPVALGTDGPDSPGLNVLFASTVTNHPSEALTREQAVTALTRGSAYAEFAEKDKGTLAPGMLADFVVLSKDIFTARASELADVQSVLTVIGGQVAYEAATTPAKTGK
jgi:predicted amidohydrolase YtcJ